MSLLKVSRLEGLTDGVFAIAMTILVLDLHIGANLLPGDLTHVLENKFLMRLAVYIGSFIILGTLWIAMVFQAGLLRKLNRPYLWTNVFYLMVICLVPFSANLVASYLNNPISIIIFAINLLCASLGQFMVLECAHVHQLNNEFYTPKLRRAVIKRIFLAPFFYIFAIIVSPWNTHIAFILLIAPIIIYIKPGEIDHLDYEIYQHVRK